MDFYLGLVIGLFMGAALGVLMVCLCVAAKDNDCRERADGP